MLNHWATSVGYDDVLLLYLIFLVSWMEILALFDFPGLKTWRFREVWWWSNSGHTSLKHNAEQNSKLPQQTFHFSPEWFKELIYIKKTHIKAYCNQVVVFKTLLMDSSWFFGVPSWNWGVLCRNADCWEPHLSLQQNPETGCISKPPIWATYQGFGLERNVTLLILLNQCVRACVRERNFSCLLPVFSPVSLQRGCACVYFIYTYKYFYREWKRAE